MCTPILERPKVSLALPCHGTNNAFKKPFLSDKSINFTLFLNPGCYPETDRPTNKYLRRSRTILGLCLI